jgi:hypothetical protein
VSEVLAKPMAVIEATTPDGLRQVDWLLANNTYDAAVEQVQATAYLRPIRRRRVPTLLICHNVEHLGWVRQVCLRAGRNYTHSSKHRLRRFEPAVVRAKRPLDGCLREDRREIERMAGVPCGLSPNGVDIDYYAFRPRRERSPEALWRLVMTGNMSYIPNIDAAVPLTIFCLLQRTQPVVEVRSQQSDSNLLARTEGIGRTLYQFVEDVRPYIAEADVFVRVAPRQRYAAQALEAMAQGFPLSRRL